jgi:hypothetical protein
MATESLDFGAAHRLSPKSPSPGMMYAFSFNPLSIQPVI